MDELIEYAKKYLAQGYSIDQIRQTLIKGGHSAREVDEVIIKVKSEQVPPKPAPLKKTTQPATPPPTGQPAPQTSTTPPTPTTNSNNYAGFGIRLGAYFIDSFLFVMVLLPFPVVMEITSGTAAPSPLFTILIPSLLACIFFLIICFMEGKYGFTPAKYLLKLRVVNEHNQPPGFIAALLRNIIKAIFIPGAIMILFDKKKQGLHDKAAKTFVIVT